VKGEDPDAVARVLDADLGRLDPPQGTNIVACRADAARADSSAMQIGRVYRVEAFQPLQPVAHLYDAERQPVGLGRRQELEVGNQRRLTLAQIGPDGATFFLHRICNVMHRVHLAASTIGVKVLLLAPAFRNMDAALEESSRVSGASAVGTLVRIITPVMMPAILVATILGLIRSLEAFEIELLLGVPVGIQVFSTKILDLVIAEPSEYPPAMALSSSFLAVLLVLVCFQRFMVRGKEFTTVTGRGYNRRLTPLGRWKNLVFVLVLLLALIVTVVPTVFLVLGMPSTWCGREAFTSDPAGQNRL